MYIKFIYTRGIENLDQKFKVFVSGGTSPLDHPDLPMGMDGPLRPDDENALQDHADTILLGKDQILNPIFSNL